MQALAKRGPPITTLGGRDRMTLTHREAEVVALVSLGLQNKEIGERLGISPATVKTHVRACLLKCGAPTRAALATWHAQARRG